MPNNLLFMPVNYLSTTIGELFNTTVSNVQKLLNSPQGQATLSTLFACSYLIPMLIESSKSENPLDTIEQLTTNLQAKNGLGLASQNALNAVFGGLGFYYAIQALLQSNVSEIWNKLYAAIDVSYIKQSIEKFEHFALAISNIEALLASLPEQLSYVQQLINANHDENTNNVSNILQNILPIMKTLYLTGMLIYHVKATMPVNPTSNQAPNTEEIKNLQVFLEKYKTELLIQEPEHDSAHGKSERFQAMVSTKAAPPGPPNHPKTKK